MRSRFFISALTVLLLSTTSATAAKKALLIGVDGYSNLSRLNNAISDAVAMGRALESLGFTVSQAHNPTRDKLIAALSVLEASIEKNDIVLVFYAGHGVEVSKTNYLLPADMPIPETAEEVSRHAIPAERLLASAHKHAPQAVLLVLDACRDNPFPGKKIGRPAGLGQMAAPGRTFVLMAADAGQTALDGLGTGDSIANSVFTRTLVAELLRPGQPLHALGRRVQIAVQRLAATVNHKQSPVYYDELATEIILSQPSPK